MHRRLGPGLRRGDGGFRVWVSARGRMRDNAGKQWATAGAWVLEPYERGCATMNANAGREIARNRPVCPVAPGGDDTGSRPVRQPRGPAPDWRCRRRSCPLPVPVGGYSARCLRAPAVNAEAKSEALIASAPVAGGYVTDMVCFVKWQSAWYACLDEMLPSLSQAPSVADQIAPIHNPLVYKVH